MKKTPRILSLFLLARCFGDSLHYQAIVNNAMTTARIYWGDRLGNRYVERCWFLNAARL